MLTAWEAEIAEMTDPISCLDLTFALDFLGSAKAVPVPSFEIAPTSRLRSILYHEKYRTPHRFHPSHVSIGSRR